MIADLWKRWSSADEDRPHVLTSDDITKITNLSDRASERWSDTFSIVLKWVFATLITLATGGVYLSLTLGVHPDAASSAMKFFFGGMLFTLVSAVAIIMPLAGKLAVTDEILALPEPEGHPIEKSKFDRLFERSSGPIYSLILALVAFVMIGAGGNTLSEGISRCSAEELKEGIRNGEAVVLGPRGSSKFCYFYEIDGLSNDPLKRALQELELLEQRQLAEPRSE